MSIPLQVKLKLVIPKKTENLEEAPKPVVGRVPRIARLLALAHRFQKMVESGTVTDYAALARLGHVTRARMSQIMSLLHLAPDIQEAILFLEPVTHGRDPIVLRDILPICSEMTWYKQRQLWKSVAKAPPVG